MIGIAVSFKLVGSPNELIDNRNHKILKVKMRLGMKIKRRNTCDYNKGI